MPAFCSLLLPTHYAKNFCWQNRRVSSYWELNNQGIAMVSSEIPSENSVCTPNLFTIRAGDKITRSYT